MTRRERLERKIERRQEWAQKAEARSNAASERSHSMMSVIPMGQPILVGHHSEQRDRNYRDRAWNLLGKSVEHQKLAEHHEAKAAGLENQLDRSIFSDDTDAVEQLEQRIAENEAKRDRMKQVNSLYRKNDAAGLLAIGIDIEQLRVKLAAAGAYWGSAPHLPYELTNLGARIRDDKKRLEQVKKQGARKAVADEAPNGVAIERYTNNEYCSVTFAEKPEREILDALKAAGFWWAKGSWVGKQDALPQCVADLLNPPDPAPIVIKGSPGGPDGKWDVVQAIQHQPFIYIHYNGSHWAGEEEDDISVLLDVLAKYRLDDYWLPGYSVDPCYGIDNPNCKRWEPSTPDNPSFIDGPRMYECNGVYRFSGNFANLSHAFCIETNHKPTIDALVTAMQNNPNVVEA